MSAREQSFSEMNETVYSKIFCTISFSKLHGYLCGSILMATFQRKAFCHLRSLVIHCTLLKQRSKSLSTAYCDPLQLQVIYHIPQFSQCKRSLMKRHKIVMMKGWQNPEVDFSKKLHRTLRKIKNTKIKHPITSPVFCLSRSFWIEPGINS